MTSERPILPSLPRGQSATRLDGLREEALYRAEICAAGVQQTACIHDPEAAPGFLFRESFGNQGRAHVIGNASASRAGPEDNNLLITQRRTGDMYGSEDGGEHDGGGALDVVVEGEQLVAVTIENGARL